MKYISTRGSAPTLNFDDVLVTGLARDGGLYVPMEWPQFSPADLRRFRNLSYAELAVEVMRPFVEGSIDDASLEAIVKGAYQDFGHPAVAPLKQLDQGLWMMELFHGPTLAFKDYAMQVLGRLFDHVLQQRGERITSSGQPPATPDQPLLRPAGTVTPSIFLSCFQTIGCHRYSNGR